ncbi:hypothetical protein PF010_g4283 [Phytophthora fragariae]|uniref:Uncharacterized protein n=1 Tax=Phytophthora fragariae TaxID=53985 RepID=A0A6G0LSB5_9STRA|nr:hypothetical protein PF010_g4283 [Phytophthora fragariae]KAE9253254.1 hypothetical protein PF004_g1591 [Phytophthora fragariae]KAE9352640.1 hypothetical protein PF008_g5369 [Phytophthora fragariae]
MREVVGSVVCVFLAQMFPRGCPTHCKAFAGAKSHRTCSRSCGLTWRRRGPVKCLHLATAKIVGVF